MVFFVCNIFSHVSSSYERCFNKIFINDNNNRNQIKQFDFYNGQKSKKQKKLRSQHY